MCSQSFPVTVFLLTVYSFPHSHEKIKKCLCKLLDNFIPRGLFLLNVLKTGCHRLQILMYSLWQIYIISHILFGLFVLQVTNPSSDRLKEILLTRRILQLRHCLTLCLSHGIRIWFLYLPVSSLPQNGLYSPSLNLSAKCIVKKKQLTRLVVYLKIAKRVNLKKLPSHTKFVKMRSNRCEVS